VASLGLKRLGLRYSLMSLRHGFAGFIQTTSMDVDGLQVLLDISRGRGTPSAASDLPAFPPPLPALSIRDAEVRIRADEFNLDLSGIRLESGRESPDGRPVQLQVLEASWAHPRIRPGRGSVAADLRLSPQAVRLDGLRLNGEPLGEQAYLDLNRAAGRFPFAARLRIGGGRLDLQGQLAGSILQAELNAQEVQLAPAANLFGLDGSGILSLDAAISLPLANPEGMSGRLDLSLRSAAFRGLQGADLRLKAALGDGWLRLDTLELQALRSRAVLGGAAAPWDDLRKARGEPLLRRLSGDFSLSSEDVPALLGLAGVVNASAASRIPDHRLALAGRVENGKLVIPRGELTSGAGRIQIQDLETILPPAGADTPLKAELRLQLPDLAGVASVLGLPQALSGSLTGKVNVSGPIGRLVGHAELAGSGLVIDGQPLGSASLRAVAERERVRVESLSFRSGRDRLEARGTVQLAKGRLDGAVVDLDITEIGNYNHLFLPDARPAAGQPPRVQGSIRGRARVSGPWGYPDGELALDFENLQVSGRRLGSGSARIIKQEDTIALAHLKCVNGADLLDVRGSFDFGTQRFEAVRLDLHALDIGPYLKAFASDGHWPAGRMSGRLEGSGPLREPEFTLEVFLERMPAVGRILRDARIDARGAGRRVRIESAQAITPLGQVRLVGDLDRHPTEGGVDLELEEFTVSGEGLSLALEAPARIRCTAPGAFTVSGFKAGGPQGRVSANGTLAVQGRSDLSIQLTELDGGGWLPKLTGMPLVVEGLNVSLQATGTAASPEISASGSARKLGAAGTALSYAGRFDLAYTAKRLQIAAFDLTGPEGHRLSLSGSLPIDPSGDPVLIPGMLEAAMAARVPDLQLIHSFFPEWPVATGSLEADLILHGSWQTPHGTLRLSGRGLTPADASGLVPPGPYEARVNASLEGGRLDLPDFAIEGPYAQLRGRGAWRELPPLPQLICAKPASWGAVSLEGRLVAADLGWLSRSFKDIRRVAGRLEVGLNAQGRLEEPDLQADIHLTGGELRPEADLPPLQALNIDARLAGRNLEIQSLRGELGGAPFQMTGAIENILAPDGRAHVNLRLKGDDLLLQRSQALRMRADADLWLSGPLERLALSGTIALTEGLFGKNFGLAEGLTAGSAKPKAGPGFELFAFQDAPLRDMVFDVGISGRRPFQIKNNLVKGAARPELHLGGTGEAPELTGRIYLDPSTLYLPAGRMQFDSGVIHFEATDPGRPWLDMVGTARMVGYEINAVVEGPYDEPAVTLSSAPQLPDEELLALVLTGQPPRTPGGETLEKRQGFNVAVFIGRDILLRMPGGGTTESLQAVLERFDVEVGRAVTRAGDETINARFRIADDMLRKGDTLYITGEKDMFDRYNAGVRIVFRFR
jgi:autotransporter translocation and assembly factor TamB